MKKVTFSGDANDVAAKHNLPLQNVEAAFSEMVRNGWFIQKKHVFPDRHAIKIVVPEWDKLIEAGLYKVKE